MTHEITMDGYYWLMALYGSMGDSATLILDLACRWLRWN